MKLFRQLQVYKAVISGFLKSLYTHVYFVCLVVCIYEPDSTYPVYLFHWASDLCAKLGLISPDYICALNTLT